MKIEGIRELIQNEILNQPDLEIEDDQDLLLSETLDSLNVTLLIAHLESACTVAIPPEDVTLENFSTLRNIEAYISRLQESSGSGR